MEGDINPLFTRPPPFFSLETGRMSSVGNVSMFDLWDTYLPQVKGSTYAFSLARCCIRFHPRCCCVCQFEAPFVQAEAAGTMCSYFSMRLEDPSQPPPPPGAYIPSCANPYLLTTGEEGVNTPRLSCIVYVYNRRPCMPGTSLGCSVSTSHRSTLLLAVVREYWNRPEATHLSDCGAVWNMVRGLCWC